MDGCSCLNFKRKKKQKSRGVPGATVPHHLLFTPSSFTSLSGFQSLRNQLIDADEGSGWTPAMAQLSQTATDHDVKKNLLAAIRTGVPDALKKSVWAHSANAWSFMDKNPTFYEQTVYQTFGTNVPRLFGVDVPTFAGGILGFEEDIQGEPVEIANWEVDLEIEKMESEGIAHAVSWTNLNAAHFAPHSPQVLRPDAISGSAAPSPSASRRGRLISSSFFSPRKGSEVIEGSSWHRRSAPASARGSVSVAAGAAPQADEGEQPPAVLQSQMTEDLSSPLNFRQYQQNLGNAAPTPWEHEADAAVAFSSLPVIQPPPGAQAGAPAGGPAGAAANDTKSNADVKFARLRSKTDVSYKIRERGSFRNMLGVDIPDRRETKPRASTSANVGIADESDYDNGQAFDRMRSADGTGKGAVYRLEAISPHYGVLSREGRNVCKKILWCINSNFGDLDFCPILPSLVTYLLCYMGEKESYAVVRCLLTEAVEGNKNKSDRTMAVYRRSDFIRLVKSVQALAAKILPKLTNHLNALGVDQAAWFARGLQDGFVRILPFNYVLRIFGSFLFEGTKVLQRYSIAILKICEGQLLKCQSRDDAALVLAGSELSDGDLETLNLLTRIAFGLSLKPDAVGIRKYTSSDLPTAYLTCVRTNKFCRPRLFETSEIVSHTEWETLWCWIPQACRILDPHKCYSSNRDGMSIMAIQKAVWKQIDSAMLFFILTTDSQVIGAYSPFAFRMDARALTAKDKSVSFVFKLRPTSVAYWWTGSNKQFMNCTFDSISIGADQVAIAIDSWIKHGCSRPSASFDSPQLAGDSSGDFDIQLLEVWLLK